MSLSRRVRGDKKVEKAGGGVELLSTAAAASLMTAAMRTSGVVVQRM